ncbi:MAG: type I-E CRISPR-associated protein Cas5/CasD, partial [Desulfatitalea sp.]|nr:type I-E CRISPR-associated protein Cas5/CasD [Desulfatitalea sp.]
MKQEEILALYLDAPLQSWGYQSRFDRRTTYSRPTRSGIIGMIAAAMGIARGDTVRLARFGALVMTTLTLGTQSDHRIPGTRLMDFHT